MAYRKTWAPSTTGPTTSYEALRPRRRRWKASVGDPTTKGDRHLRSNGRCAWQACCLLGPPPFFAWLNHTSPPRDRPGHVSDGGDIRGPSDSTGSRWPLGSRPPGARTPFVSNRAPRGGRSSFAAAPRAARDLRSTWQASHAGAWAGGDSSRKRGAKAEPSSSPPTPDRGWALPGQSPFNKRDRALSAKTLPPV